MKDTQVGVFKDGKLLLPQKYCAVVLGISVQALQKYNLEPVEVSGRTKWYDITAIVKSKIESPHGAYGDLSAQRTRLAKAKADQAELEQQIRSGELLEVDVVLSEVEKAVMAMKSRLLRIPKEMAGPLENRKRETVRRELDDAIYGALEELASSDFIDVQTTGKTNGKRVGRQKPKAKSRGKRGAGKVAH